MFANCVWFTFIQRNISVELLISNFIDMALMILIARSLLRAEDGQRPFADVVTSFVYALLAIATCGVILDFFRSGNFSPEYNFNCPRAIFNGVAAIVTEGIPFVPADGVGAVEPGPHGSSHARSVDRPLQPASTRGNRLPRNFWSRSSWPEPFCRVV
jgi:hypothetical protein